MALVALLQLAHPAMSAGTALPGFSSERLDRIDALVGREIEAGRLAGLVVTVARDGKVMQRDYGYMSFETREKMRPDAIFRLYSMTKPVASVALLTLYEKGLFELTDPLDKYIPQFANLKVMVGKDGNGEPILQSPKRKPTIQDAFRHTLGLSGGLGNTDVDALYRKAGLGLFELESLSQQMDRLAQVPLRYSPGDQWVYGLGHDVQAYLVEVFSGMKYEEYGARQSSSHRYASTVFGFGAMKAAFRWYTTAGRRQAGGQTRRRYARFTDMHSAR